MIREARYYARMAAGLYQMIRAPRPSNPTAIVLDQLEHRVDRFLETLHRVVFTRPGHPYRAMFDHARCEFEDFRRLCVTGSLETALEHVRQGGVYLTHDEFKGHQPIVRGGKEIPAQPADFLNPLAVKGNWRSTSGGSRSAGSVTPASPEYRVYREAAEMIAVEAMGVRGKPTVLVVPILPAPYGFTRCMSAKRAQSRCVAWFAVGSTFRKAGHYRALTSLLAWQSRLLGVHVPRPRYLADDDFTPVAQMLATLREQGQPAFVPAVVTPAVRVVDAARRHSLDISGTVFWLGGEAVTDARRRLIEEAGCLAYANYFISEVGLVGSDCSSSPGGNSVHLFSDNAVAIGWRRPARLSDRMVDSLLFTTIHPLNPRILINAEMDDSAVIEPATCDCPLSRAGFRTRLSNIYSFGKLTGHGTTLVGGEVLRILELVLPARFGGTPADYQLVEEDVNSEAKVTITLRVHPRLGITSLDPIRECFLAEIECLFGGALTVREWRHAGTVKVIAAPPIQTRGGKTLPLHLLHGGSPHTSPPSPQ